MYVGVTGDRQCLVVDGVEGPFFDLIAAESGPCFGPDGKYAYSARSGQDFFVVVGDRKFGPYGGLVRGSLSFSPDGKRYAFGAGDRKPRRRVFGIIDGEISGDYLDILEDTPRFTADSKHVIYGGLDSTGWHLVFDGQAGPAWAAITPYLAPQGEGFAYAAQKGRVFSKQVVVVNHRQIGEYKTFAQGGVIFSPDGHHFAYAARGGGFDAPWSVYLGDRKIGDYSGVGELRFLPNNTTVVFLAQGMDFRSYLVWQDQQFRFLGSGAPVAGLLSTLLTEFMQLYCLRMISSEWTYPATKASL